MNHPSRRVIPGLALLALAGCATTPEDSAMAPPAPMHGQATIVSDAAYINSVEALARKRGIQVQWVHPPNKRLLATSD